MRTGNLNASTEQSELYKVRKDAAFDGDGDSPYFKPLLFTVRLPHSCTLNFLGHPEVGGTRFMQNVGSRLPNSTESHRKNPKFPSLIILSTLFCLCYSTNLGCTACKQLKRQMVYSISQFNLESHPRASLPCNVNRANYSKESR